MPLAFQHVSVSIDRPLAEVKVFLAEPSRFMEWASGLASSLHQEDGRWVAETPEGMAEVQFSPPNDFGVADHRVLLPRGKVVNVPLRAIAHGDHTIVTLTLLREPTTDDATFARDVDWVRRDLETLKRVLEGS